MGKLCDALKGWSAVTRGTMILFGLKFLYLIGLLVYLIYYSVFSGSHGSVLKGLDEVIQNMGVPSLVIAALIGLALECTGFYGLITEEWAPNVVYLLMHLSVVPLYLCYSKFRYLWLLYVASLIMTFFGLYTITVDEYFDAAARVYLSNRIDVEANRGLRSNQPMALQSRGIQCQTRGQTPEMKLKFVTTRVRDTNLPKLKNPQTPLGIQNQTRMHVSQLKTGSTAQSPGLKYRFEQKVTYQESSFVLPIPASSLPEPTPTLPMPTFVLPKQYSVLPIPDSVLPKPIPTLPTTNYEEPTLVVSNTNATKEYDQEDYIEEKGSEEENHKEEFGYEKSDECKCEDVEYSSEGFEVTKESSSSV